MPWTTSAPERWAKGCWFPCGRTARTRQMDAGLEPAHTGLRLCPGVRAACCLDAKPALLTPCSPEHPEQGRLLIGKEAEAREKGFAVGGACVHGAFPAGRHPHASHACAWLRCSHGAAQRCPCCLRHNATACAVAAGTPCMAAMYCRCTVLQVGAVLHSAYADLNFPELMNLPGGPRGGSIVGGKPLNIVLGAPWWVRTSMWCMVHGVAWSGMGCPRGSAGGCRFLAAWYLSAMCASRRLLPVLHMPLRTPASHARAHTHLHALACLLPACSQEEGHVQRPVWQEDAGAAGGAGPGHRHHLLLGCGSQGAALQLHGCAGAHLHASLHASWAAR